jgi:hypothetical protein
MTSNRKFQIVFLIRTNQKLHEKGNIRKVRYLSICYIIYITYYLWLLKFEFSYLSRTFPIQES